MNKYKRRHGKIIIKSELSLLKFEELDDMSKALVKNAIEATDKSYSPYSHFKVGAALRLEDGTIVIGANQEMQHFPLLCVLNVLRYLMLSLIIQSWR